MVYLHQLYVAYDDTVLTDKLKLHIDTFLCDSVGNMQTIRPSSRNVSVDLMCRDLVKHNKKSGQTE